MLKDNTMKPFIPIERVTKFYVDSNHIINWLRYELENNLSRDLTGKQIILDHWDNIDEVFVDVTKYKGDIVSSLDLLEKYDFTEEIIVIDIEDALFLATLERKTPWIELYVTFN